MRSRFLPDRLRPRLPRRRPRARLLLLVLVPLPAMALPLWQVSAVELEGCDGLPDSVRSSLQDLVGRSPLTVDPGRVREQIEACPTVAEVEVELELPGTLRVHVTPARAVASLQIGSGWLAVTSNGESAGALPAPQAPVLAGFDARPSVLRQALAVVRRLESATGGTVDAVRRITPADFEVRLRSAAGDRSAVLRVLPEATAAERRWCDWLVRGVDLESWADLRFETRLVMGGAA